MGLSTTHLLLLLVVVVLLFGRGKISELMGDVGKGINSFKKGLSEEDQTTASSQPKAIDQAGQSADPQTRTKSL
jgi:sec-independent protein translocase protein TatA